MLTVYACVTERHDLKLVVVAAIICALSALTSILLLRHIRRQTGTRRRAWIFSSACVSGFGIWATHFLSMLAFRPFLDNGFDQALTGLSLMLAIALTGLAFAVLLLDLRWSAIAGGTLFGLGVAAMHFTGMAGFKVAGRMHWDPAYVSYALATGALFGMAAMQLIWRGASLSRQLWGALLFTCAICGLHFLGMAAVSITPDPRIALPDNALPLDWLAPVIMVVSLVILGLSMAALWLDARDRRIRFETSRMRGLANAAVEGLIIYGRDGIVTGNKRFADLIGVWEEALPGLSFEQLFDGSVSLAMLMEHQDKPFESWLGYAGAAPVPVEIVLHMVDLAGTMMPAIAVRDLRRQREAEKQIRFLADHDPLTGLPNRSHFQSKLNEQIALCQAKGSGLAVLCLDLDRFKDVNDLHGHAAGDKFLKYFATVVREAVEPGQMIARLGDDEFAVMLPDIADPSAAGRQAEDILAALKQIFSEVDSRLSLSASIGIAIWPDNGDDAGELMTASETALYRAKVEERGNYRFFAAAMGEQVRTRRLLEEELRSAIARDELRLVYQPQMDVRSGAIVGMEALVRWHNPQRGNVPPDQFIPLAEECGAIIAIGEWVLREACRAAASWDCAVSLAVNVSAVQIISPGFAVHVHEILLETGLSPRRLELEITETALVGDFNSALVTLRQLKGLGIRIAMDDFGTGYSSLYTLRAFPFDKIKIDRSFVSCVHANDQAATIVRAVLGIGRGLGVPVVAEGVETPEELAFLRDEGCDEAQGYLIGKPAQIEDMGAMLDQAAAGGEAPSRRISAG